MRVVQMQSVFIWSFCNEVGCDNETAAAAFRAISKYWDPTRDVTQNHHGLGGSTKSLDVQGFSHRSGADFDAFHKLNPLQPEMATECCSCLSQRGSDFDTCPVPRTCVGSSCHVWCGGRTGAEEENGTFYNNEISDCTARQVNESDAREFVAGTFVWSGFDYLGEASKFQLTLFYLLVLHTCSQSYLYILASSLMNQEDGRNLSSRVVLSPTLPGSRKRRTVSVK